MFFRFPFRQAAPTCISLIVVLAALEASRAAENVPGHIDFAAQIAPILQQSCVDCHGPELQMAGLRLDQRALAFAGGDSGEAIASGDSKNSLIIQRLVDRKLGILMPPSFPFFPGEKAGLREEQIKLLKDWIDQGAAWPDDISLSAGAGSAEPGQAGQELFAAIRAGDQGRVKELIADSSLLRVQDWQGSTPLLRAALYADADMVRLLAQKGADVNAATRDGVTALMWAAGDAEKVRVLLEKGAKVNARTSLGRTPLLIAATYAGNSETVRLLLEKGANISDQDALRETALTSAAKRGDARMVKILIDAGADLNAGGRPPLVWAAEEGSVEAVKCLLDHGAAAHQESLNGALFSAAVRGPLEVVKLLLDRGADPNSAAGFAGYTPLMGAAYSESAGAETVGLLLAKGADLKAKGANGETGLSLARKHGRTPAVKLLEDAGAME